MKLSLPSTIAAVCLLVACGGAPPPAAEPSGPKEAASATPPAADERKEFMSECAKEPGMDGYCTCSYDYIVKNTTAQERNEPASPKLSKAVSQLPEACGEKLPAAKIKDTFMKSCVQNPAAAAYCSCSFEYLQKKGLVTKGAEAVKSVEPEVKKACAAELFDIAKRGFIKGCEEKQSAKVCTCTFDALEKSNGKEKLLGLLERGDDEGKKAVRGASKGCGAK